MSTTEWGPRERCLLGGSCGTQVSSVGMGFALGSSVRVGRGLLRRGGKDTTESLRPVPRIGQRNGDGLRADECHVFSVHVDYLLLNIRRVKSCTYYHLCSCWLPNTSSADTPCTGFCASCPRGSLPGTELKRSAVPGPLNWRHEAGARWGENGVEEETDPATHLSATNLVPQDARALGTRRAK